MSTFSKKDKYLVRDNVRRSLRLKNTYALSLRRSMGLDPHQRKFMKIYLRVSLGRGLVKKYKNICLLTGENRAVRKYFLASRFRLNDLGIGNKLQNFRPHSW
jgi:hypothetical protein